MYLGFGVYLGLVWVTDQERITIEKIESPIVPQKKGHLLPRRPSEEAPGLVRRQTEGRESISTVLHRGCGGKG